MNCVVAQQAEGGAGALKARLCALFALSSGTIKEDAQVLLAGQALAGQRIALFAQGQIARLTLSILQIVTCGALCASAIFGAFLANYRARLCVTVGARGFIFGEVAYFTGIALAWSQDRASLTVIDQTCCI